jgi:hypothetical protein
VSVVDADHLVHVIIGLDPNAVPLAGGSAGMGAGKTGHERIMKWWERERNRSDVICPSDGSAGGATGRRLDEI